MWFSRFISDTSNLINVVWGAIALAALLMTLQVRWRQNKMARRFGRQLSEQEAAILKQLRVLVRDIADCFEAGKMSSLQLLMQDIKREIREPAEARAAIDQIESATHILASWFDHYSRRVRRSDNVELLLGETTDWVRSFERLIKQELRPVVESSGCLSAHVADEYNELGVKYNLFKDKLESLMRTATEELGRHFQDHFEFIPEMKSGSHHK